MKCAASGPGVIVDPHHVVYKRHLLDRNEWPWDPLDGIPLCRACHDAHHYEPEGKLATTFIPDVVLDYAFRTLGAYAFDYLGRYYRVDGDLRLESQLARAA
jgi:hypothetical protein